MKKILILFISIWLTACGNDYEYRDSFVFSADPQIEFLEGVTSEQQIEIEDEFYKSLRYFGFYITDSGVFHKCVFVSEFGMPEIFYDQWYQLQKRIDKRFDKNKCKIQIRMYTYRADVRGVPIEEMPYTAEIIF